MSLGRCELLGFLAGESEVTQDPHFCTSTKQPSGLFLFWAPPLQLLPPFSLMWTPFP